MKTSSRPGDFATACPMPQSGYGHQAVEVENMPPELPDQNLFLGDEALVAACSREGVQWINDRAEAAGKTAGSRHFRELARLANENKPVLRTHDRIGRRIDFVEFHPAYHELMAETFRSEVHSLAWTTNEKRPQTARTILFYLWNQVENGTVGCANLMSYAIVPLLRSDPQIGDRWLSKVLSTEYDPRPLHADEKPGLTVAMAMTERQGGSDLRSNDTQAVPTGNEREYHLSGQKFFVSAPMGDLLLLTAKTDSGVTLFIAPRTLANGERNSIHIQRLKDKLGNTSNASSEVELNNTVAYRIGEDGRGIRQFIKYMTQNIRMGLSTGSAGIMRCALTLALHHTSNRSAFGSTIHDLPQMSNTLADLAIESEAAFLLGLRAAKAVDDSPTSDTDKLLSRILVPVAKYWNCRRASAVTLEAMECHGGMGYVEEQTIARLYREAPLNSIWEGTSAMMGLDMIRAFDAFPDSRDALVHEIKLATGSDRHFDAYVKNLEGELGRSTDMMEPHARRLMSMIAQALQGSLLIRQSTQEVADTFCASRLGGEWAYEFGTLQETGAPLRKIIDRAAISQTG